MTWLMKGLRPIYGGVFCVATISSEDDLIDEGIETRRCPATAAP